LVQHISEISDLFLLHPSQVVILLFCFYELFDFSFLFEYVFTIFLPLSLLLSALLLECLCL
jgi:hypothetical protein